MFVTAPTVQGSLANLSINALHHVLQSEGM